MESGIVTVEKLAPLRQEWSQREAVRHRRAARTGERLGERESMRRANRDFPYNPEASEDFLITLVNSSLILLPFPAWRHQSQSAVQVEPGGFEMGQRLF